MGNKHADAMQAAHDAALVNLFSPASRLQMAEDDANRLHHEKMDQYERALKFELALRAIIERADNGPLTSKVQDMKRIALEALGE